MRNPREFAKDIKANDINWLSKEYSENLRGLKDIATECNTTEDSIRTRLKRFGIPIRNHTEALCIRNKKYPFFPTKEQVEKTNISRRTGRFVSCLFCKEDFYITRKSTRKFCSFSCRKNYLKENRNRNQDWRFWVEYKEWRDLIYFRDQYKCKICGSKKEINAHHIFDGHNFPEKRFDMNNGVTLCKEHHKQIHSPYNKELLLQTPNIGGSLEVDNPEAAIRDYLISLIRSND